MGEISFDQSLGNLLGDLVNYVVLCFERSLELGEILIEVCDWGANFKTLRV